MTNFFRQVLFAGCYQVLNDMASKYFDSSSIRNMVNVAQLFKNYIKALYKFRCVCYPFISGAENVNFLRSSSFHCNRETKRSTLVGFRSLCRK